MIHGAMFALEIGHIMDHRVHGHAELREHSNSLLGVGERQDLGRCDDYGPRKRQLLAQR